MRSYVINVTYGDAPASPGRVETFTVWAGTATAALKEAIRVAALHEREVATISAIKARPVIAAEVLG